MLFRCDLLLRESLAIQSSACTLTRGLAMLIYRGRGVQADAKRAKELLLQAAAVDYAQAYTQLGNMAVDEKVYRQAVGFYRKAIELKNDSEAQFKYGQWLEKGFGIPVEAKPAAGFELYARSARQGYLPAIERSTTF